MKDLKVSIIIPVYNVEKFLEECILSILNQTYKNLEIIVVNDGSKDNSVNIIEKFLKKDSRIKVINKKNGGLSSARNAGIEIATGDYLMHVDGDDFLKNDVIEKMITKIEKSKENVDVAIGDIELQYESGISKTKKDSDMKDGEIYNGLHYLEKYFFVGKACYSSCNKLWKRSLYIDNNIRHPLEISLGEDSNTVVRLMLHAKKILKLDSSVYNYRINEGSMTNLKTKKILEYKKSIELLESYFSERDMSEYFKKYKTSHTFFSLYEYVLYLSKRDILKIYENNSNYITTRNLFKNDIKNIVKDKVLIENISLKQKLVINMYNYNFELAEKLIDIYKKIR